MRNVTFSIFILFIIAGCGASKKTIPKDYIFRNESDKKTYIDSYNKSLQLWSVAFQEEDIQTTFGKAHIIMAGPKEGSPIVLLHGMDATSTMWFPNIKALSKNHRVYAIDFLNEVGKSQSTEKSISTEEIVTWYNEIFSHYKLKDFALVGASKGGWLATLLATQNENKIEKLILLSPAQTFQNIDKAGKAFSALALKTFPNRKKLEKTLKAFSFYPEKINEVYKNQFYLANKLSKSSSNFLQMKPFSDDDLRKITIPVLVVVGDNDIINSDETLIRARKYLSNPKTQTIQNAGHFLSIDQSQTVNKLMVDFLN